MPVSPELQSRIQSMYPWMTMQMLDAYTGSWSEFADTNVALREVRATADYATVFAGNLDPVSGDVRMTETEYFASKASFDATLEGVGVNPAHFQDEWEAALEGEVSPSEMLTRVEAAYERIIQAAPEIRDYYSSNFGIEMTDSAILASALSPRVGSLILNRQISMAEIGGSAYQRGFDAIQQDFVSKLAETGMTQRGADEFFGTAADLIPAMNVLSSRHADANDAFDLNDVSAAFLFDDPGTRRRIRRLQAQESSAFTGGATTDYRRDSTGVAGLTQT